MTSSQACEEPVPPSGSQAVSAREEWLSMSATTMSRMLNAKRKRLRG